MTDNELLLALSKLFDKKLKPIEVRLASLEEKVQSLEERVSSLEERMSSLEGRMYSLEERMNSLEERMSSLEGRVYSLEGRMCCVENEIKSLKEEVRLQKLQNENVILPRLQNIEVCYLSTYERYKNGIARIDQMQTDVDILKNIVAEHGRRLEEVYS